MSCCGKDETTTFIRYRLTEESWISGAYAFQGIPFFGYGVVNAKNVVPQGILHCGGTEMQEKPWIMWKYQLTCHVVLEDLLYTAKRTVPRTVDVIRSQ